jgi:hypothetical protein
VLGGFGYVADSFLWIQYLASSFGRNSKFITQLRSRAFFSCGLIWSVGRLMS